MDINPKKTIFFGNIYRSNLTQAQAVLLSIFKKFRKQIQVLWLQTDESIQEQIIAPKNQIYRSDFLGHAKINSLID